MVLKRGVKIFLLAFIAVVLALAVYFTFFFAYTCDDADCFVSHQQECAPTKYIKDTEDAVWSYHIKGEDNGRCEIEVSLLQLKKGEKSKLALEGKSMICNLPLESISPPEGDITRCHGLLKEEMQNTIIQKLHAYILENLGEVDSALAGLTGSVEVDTSSEIPDEVNVSDVF